MDQTDGIDEVEDSEEGEEVLDESLKDDEGLYHMHESALTYFGADFDVRGLVTRLNDGDIVIPRFDPDESEGTSLAGFQRRRVWPRARAEKFIESLLLGWPVPSIFLVVEPDQRYLVLDGQQRLTALQSFYDGAFPDGTEFALGSVVEHLQGSTYETLGADSKRRLNNTFIQATVIEPEGKDGAQSVYRLFDRLNSGGMSLTPQEIRVALFLGPAIHWIRELNSDDNWRKMYGATSPRLKDHELILRILVMEKVVAKVAGRWRDENLRLTAYTPPMSNALNSFLEENREMKNIDRAGLTQAFQKACELLFQAADRDGVRYNGRLNAAHIDALISSLMWLHDQGTMPSKRKVSSALSRLRKDETYNEFVTQSTSHRENVYGRLQLALDALS